MAFFGTTMQLTFNSLEYLRLINDEAAQSRLNPGTSISVVGDVSIPQETRRLPDNLTTFQHNFSAVDAALLEFNHVVKGTASFTRCNNLESFGDNCVFGDLFLKALEIEEFNSKVIGGAEFLECKRLKQFGPDCYFGRYIGMVGCGIEEFNHVVKGTAVFNNCESLKVLGPNYAFASLTLLNSPITEYNVPLSRDLTIKNCSQLQKFGINCQFEGYFECSGSGLVEFNHQVKNNAILSNNLALETLGPDCSFGGNLDASGTSLSGCNSPVQGSAFFHNNAKFKSLGPNFSVGGSLVLFKTSVESINIVVPEVLDVRALTFPITLGPNFKSKDILTAGTDILFTDITNAVHTLDVDVVLG